MRVVIVHDDNVRETIVEIWLTSDILHKMFSKVRTIYCSFFPSFVNFRPLCITIGGGMSPSALMTAKTVDVSPHSTAVIYCMSDRQQLQRLDQLCVCSERPSRLGSVSA